MIKFFKSLPTHVHTACTSIFRHMAMSLSAISAVGITLILLSIFLMVAGNIALFSDHIEDELRIHVVLDETILEEEDIHSIETEINAISGVKSVAFSSKDEELELMIQERGEDLAMYRGEENPLSNGFFVSIKNANQIESINEQIKALDGVKDAVYGGTSVSKLVSMLDSIRHGGIIFVTLLAMLAIFLIANAIKMTIYARNTEISIMRNVGAANWYIRVPFMVEGMLIGLIGAIIPCILTYIGYHQLYTYLDGQIVMPLFSLQPIVPFTLYISAILAAAGMIVGFLGSCFSVSRYLHWRR